MLNKIPLKSKAYIFMALSMIAIAIVVSAGIENHERKVKESEVRLKVENAEKQQGEQKVLSEKKKTEEVQNALDEKKKSDEEQKTLEENKKQAQIKAIDDKYNKGYEAYQNKQYNTAISIEDDVIAQDSKNYKAYTIKGIALCYSNRFEQGMACIDKALEIKPDYDKGRFNKALANELYAHYDEALKWYDKALQVDNFVWSYYGKASIYGRYGDVKNAVANLKIAISMDSAVSDVAAKEVDFTNVKGSKEFQELIKK